MFFLIFLSGFFLWRGNGTGTAQRRELSEEEEVEISVAMVNWSTLLTDVFSKMYHQLKKDAGESETRPTRRWAKVWLPPVSMCCLSLNCSCEVDIDPAGIVNAPLA